MPTITEALNIFIAATCASDFGQPQQFISHSGPARSTARSGRRGGRRPAGPHRTSYDIIIPKYVYSERYMWPIRPQLLAGLNPRRGARLARNQFVQLVRVDGDGKLLRLHERGRMIKNSSGAARRGGRRFADDMPLEIARSASRRGGFERGQVFSGPRSGGINSE